MVHTLILDNKSVVCNAIRLKTQINSANSQIGPLPGYQNTLNLNCKIEAAVLKAWANPKGGRGTGSPIKNKVSLQK